jgi:hypothetical protein
LRKACIENKTSGLSIDLCLNDDHIIDKPERHLFEVAVLQEDRATEKGSK